VPPAVALINIISCWRQNRSVCREAVRGGSGADESVSLATSRLAFAFLPRNLPLPAPLYRSLRQTDRHNLRTSTAFLLLGHITEESLFRQLGTVEQLGNLRWSFVRLEQGICTFNVVVQSPCHAVAQLSVRICYSSPVFLRSQTQVDNLPLIKQFIRYFPRTNPEFFPLKK